MEDTITNKSKQTILYRRSLLSDYVNHNLLAFQYLRNRNYKTAMTTFEKCIELSRELDDIKHVESLTNFGVCLYFCGRFSDSYISLEKAKHISNKLIENYLNDKSIQYLHLRVLCNLSLTSLSLNKISDSKSLFKDCIELIKSQFEVHEKIQMLKELVYIFFRIDSLKNYYEQNMGINLDSKEDNDVSMMNGKMISKTLYSLHKTLRENNIEYWMKCLNDEAKKLRSLKDINGYVFVLINSFAANFYQSGKISEGVKTNFSKILKIYAEQYNKDLKLKEKNLNVIFTDFKNRIDTAIEIYKKLLDTETELNNLLESLNQEKNSQGLQGSQDKHVLHSEKDIAKSNKIFIRLFFKHALRQLNENSDNQNFQNALQIQTNNSQANLNLNLNTNPQLNFIGVNNNNIQVNAYSNTDIKNQIELALKLVENDEFDCSKLNIFNINSEITKSLRILFENLVSIRNKCLLNIYFKNYMSKTFGFYSIMVKRDFKSQEFMDKKLEALYKGAILTKIHFSSSGFSRYFYKLDKNTKALLIYKSDKLHIENKDKPYKSIPISEIQSIVYGLSSSNLRKRYKNLNEKNLNSPWLFMSLMMNKRSIDFYFDNEETLCTWYYGLWFFIKTNRLPIKSPCISQFVLRKTKLKLIQKLKEIAEKDEKNPNKSLLILTQLNNYIINNELGFQSLTFIQVLLLYRKIKEKQGI